MSAEPNEFADPLWCPRCRRVAGPEGWDTNPRFGFRRCPRCHTQGRHNVIPCQLPADDPRAVRWRQRQARGSS